MNRKTTIIDLSVPTEESPSEALSLKVVHQSHKETAPVARGLFRVQGGGPAQRLGLCQRPRGYDLPFGHPSGRPLALCPQSEGKPARTIDQIPLEWCYGDGVVLDFRQKPHGAAISSEDLRQELSRIDYTPKPYDIVLIMTGADKFWGQAKYFDAGCGMSRESTL